MGKQGRAFVRSVSSIVSAFENGGQSLDLRSFWSQVTREAQCGAEGLETAGPSAVDRIPAGAGHPG